MITNSVKSINPFKSLPVLQTGVIQTIYDMVKTHGGEIKLGSLTQQQTGTSFVASGQQYSKAGAIFIVILPIV
jgi:hypothetical protein